MKTFTVIGYEYNELSPEAQNCAEQWYLNDTSRSDFLADDFIESFARYFFPTSKLSIQWSLSSCQGDGVNMYGRIELNEVIDYIRNWKPEEHRVFGGSHSDPRGLFTEEELAKLEGYIERSGISSATIPSNRRYTYCTAFQIEDFEEAMEEVLFPDEKKDPEAVALLSRFKAVVTTVIENLCEEMERYGYSYLYEVDKEEMQESCLENEWYFDAMGNFLKFPFVG